MPIFVNKNISNHCRLGVWKITESYEQLLSRLQLDANDTSTLLGFKNPKRQREWMSVRVMLNELTGRPTKILYNGNRKPYLSDQSYNISISHSDQYSTILMCRDKHVGIDIEKMQPKIDQIAFKFLQEREMGKIDNLQRIYHLYLHWCAKEALYKICDRPNLSFRENMFIEPFQPKRQGIITGRVETSEIHLRLKLYYFSVENYSIVWCYK